MKIEYYLYDFAYNQYHTKLRQLAKRPDVVKLCDIGGGANPLLSPKEIQEYGLEYTVLDICLEELSKASKAYHKVQADITDPKLFVNNKYDLVCSQFLAEHISSAKIFHENIFNLLKDKGQAFHYFPTLYNLHKLESIKSQLLIKYPVPYLTQFAHVLLKK